ncbi:MAG: PH domain-containing protein [Spirochaetaceae bacterium]|nr:PH domain-containing protein [Spirochaetaceae bacterium]
MDINNLSIKAKEFGIWINIFNRRLFYVAASSISDDEKILFMTKAHQLKTSKYPVIITDKGVYVAKYRTLYGGLQHWAFPIDKITNVFHYIGIFFDTIVVSIEGDAVVIGKQSKKKANKIIEIFNGLRSGNKSDDN